MDLDIAINRGNAEKPAIIFIHGLGMDKDIWINPSESRILGGMFPLKVLLSKRPSTKDFGLGSDTPEDEVPKSSPGVRLDTIETLFEDLRIKGYTVITWSQERPSGAIDYAVSELEEVIKFAHELTKAGLILIGHSRGGLIGKKYLLKKNRSIRGLITISSPHKGSSIAKIVNYLSPLSAVISPLFPQGDKGTFSFAIKRIFDFLRSTALKELLPDSHFFKSLKDEPFDWIYYVSVGGTDPTLFNLYNFSIPDIFEKIIPENLYPEEIKKGKGDGLVSAESSRIPWSNEHYNLSLNHAQILFDKEVRDLLVKAVEKIG